MTLKEMAKSWGDARTLRQMKRVPPQASRNTEFKVIALLTAFHA